MLLFVTNLSFAAATVVIDSASVNGKLTQLSISGQGFDPSGQAPKVTFNTSNLTVISFSNSSIVAALPTGTKSGSYQANGYK